MDNSSLDSKFVHNQLSSTIFNQRELEYKRSHYPLYYPAAEGDPAYPVISDFDFSIEEK